MLRKSDVSILGWMKWICGSGTYFWYMMVLVILFVIFRKIKGQEQILILIPLVSVISFLSNDTFYPYLWNWGGDYLNFFNWSIFFWIGYQIRVKGKKDKVVEIIKSRKKMLLVLYLISVGCMVGLEFELNYRRPVYVIYVVLFMAAAVAISDLLEKRKNITKAGRYSFTIYLLHMPVAGVVNYIVSLLNDVWILVLLKPIVTLMGVMVFIYIYLKCIQKAGKYERVLKEIVGLR